VPGTPPARYAYLGPRGTFAEGALRTIPAAARGDLQPYASIPATLEAVRRGDADYALVPVENSVEGSVSVTLDELATGAPLMVTREVLLPVTFALVARPGTALTGVRSVATHPHAAAQCRRWLETVLPDAAVLPAHSTAAAAAALADGSAGHDAAIASTSAAAAYRLEVLADDIADDTGAITRFLLLTRPAAPPGPTGCDKTSLVAVTEDRPGALQAVLEEFAVRRINLTRIESRPTGERLGTYSFTIDCEGHVEDVSVGDAIAGLRRQCLDVRFLGSYPRVLPPDETTDAAKAWRERELLYRDAVNWVSRLRSGRF
jgi:prephenate dehydratase